MWRFALLEECRHGGPRYHCGAVFGVERFFAPLVLIRYNLMKRIPRIETFRCPIKRLLPTRKYVPRTIRG